MDDAPFCGRADRLADRHEQLRWAWRQVVVVAVLGDRHAVDELHDEKGSAVLCGAAIENTGDVDVVHHGQRLPLRLEAGDDLPAVHARLDDLEGDLALHRLRLLGHPDYAHAAFANLLQELVRADDRAGAFGRSMPFDRGSCGRFQKARALLVPLQQLLDSPAKNRVVGASTIQEGRSLCRIFFFQGFNEESLFLHIGCSGPVVALGSTLDLKQVKAPDSDQGLGW